MRDMLEREFASQPAAHRRRIAISHRQHGTGLEYGLIAAALAVAIVTVAVGVGTRFGSGAIEAPGIVISDGKTR